MGQTIAEKILSRAAGRPVSPGEIADIAVDRLFINDFVGPIAISQFQSLGDLPVKNADRVLFGIDHRVPPADVKAANDQKLCRDFCAAYGIERFAELGQGNGVGHQLMVEQFTLPGEVALGTDSHATMYGGLGAFSCGITSSDAAVVLATGMLWLQIPASVRIEVTGELPAGVAAKDLSLAMMGLGDSGTFLYRALELTGEGIARLSVSSRLTLSNMAAELGIKSVVVEADEKTARFVGRTAEECSLIRADSDAKYERRFSLDASGIQPLIACPDKTSNVHPVSQLAGLPVDQVFLGSCTNGRIEDIEQALEILNGRKVKKGVRLLVVPASQQVLLEAVQKGYVEKLIRAGAAIATPSCAACAGSGVGLIGDGERAVSTTNRNFKGRMGSSRGEVYLSSAYTAAAAAVAGVICDPREFL